MKNLNPATLETNEMKLKIIIPNKRERGSLPTPALIKQNAAS